MRVLATWMYFDRKQIHVEPRFGRRQRQAAAATLGMRIKWTGKASSDLVRFVQDWRMSFSANRIPLRRDMREVGADSLQQWTKVT